MNRGFSHCRSCRHDCPALPVSGRAAWSLIELLIVLAIIAIILALVLAALQSAMEVANVTKCKNNLSQLAKGALAHESSRNQFPTGGWGIGDVGDPDRGYNHNQPGGWVYNLLPLTGYNELYLLGAGKSIAEKQAANAQRVQTPLSLFNCPTRRTGGPYPNAWKETFGQTSPVSLCARTDYAANSGDQQSGPYNPNQLNQIYSAPYPLNPGNTPIWHDTSWVTGVIFQQSEIRNRDFDRSRTDVYLIGEKYLNPDNYYTGLDGGDNENMYVGWDDDTNRLTGFAPLRDLRGYYDNLRFGSAHPSGFNMAFCDGSVSLISFSIDPAVHRQRGRRK